MAELHRVEINEKAPNEIEPEEAQTDEVAETSEEQQTERPEWLPEKFKSANPPPKSNKKKNHNKPKRPRMRTTSQKLVIITKLLWKLVRSSFKMTVNCLKKLIKSLKK
jgi:hypothetical protein